MPEHPLKLNVNGIVQSHGQAIRQAIQCWAWPLSLKNGIGNLFFKVSLLHSMKQAVLFSTELLFTSSSALSDQKLYKS